jgi:hypothetical protein
MSNELCFVCPKCFLAFYRKCKYEQLCKSDHPGPEFKGAHWKRQKG